MRYPDLDAFLTDGKAALAKGPVAMVFADCDVLEAQLVKQQWAKAMGDADEREDFIISIFNRLFDVNNDARGVFERVRGDNTYSPQFRAHAMRVLGGLDLCIGALDQTARLDASLAHLNSQHVERKIPAEYWPVSIFRAST